MYLLLDRKLNQCQVCLSFIAYIENNDIVVLQRLKLTTELNFTV